MDIEGKTIWQQAAGDNDRNYADIFLRWDVVLNGPGYAGAWPGCRAALQADECSARKLTDLWRFGEEMRDGDIVVLRIGTARPLGHTAMINFLGEMPDRTRLLALEGLAYHDYGKEPRPGRKLGHCTILKATARDRDRALAAALKSIEWC